MVTVDVYLDHLAETVFVRFFHCKVTPPTFCTVLFERNLLCEALTSKGGSSALLLEGVYIYELFGILLYGRITWSYSVLIDEYSYIKEYLYPSISPIHPRYNQDLYQHRLIHIIL